MEAGLCGGEGLLVVVEAFAKLRYVSGIHDDGTDDLPSVGSGSVISVTSEGMRMGCVSQSRL